MQMIRGMVQLLCFNILLVNLLACYAQTKHSNRKKTGWNPVLLMEYNPSTVKYDQFPLSLKPMCEKYLADENNTIYAQIKLGGAEYIANMGDWHSNVEEYDNGELILVGDGTCQSSELEWTLMSLPPKNGYHVAESKETFPGRDSPRECVPGQCHPVFRSANEEVALRNFVRDSIQRSIKAYGGDVLFRQLGCKSEVNAELLDSGYIIVLQELKAFCLNKPQK